jgi:hypothetical protein
MSITSDGPADLLAVDDLGRRAGYLAGQVYDEIPGVQLAQISGMQSLPLPTTNQY